MDRERGGGGDRQTDIDTETKRDSEKWKKTFSERAEGKVERGIDRNRQKKNTVPV